MKLKPVNSPDGSLYGVRWDCPGCKEPHIVPTVGPKAWGFNGDMARPTLTPSVLNRWSGDDDGKPVEEICHVFIRDGRIEFLGDCTHEFAGKTVDLPHVTEPSEAQQ